MFYSIESAVCIQENKSFTSVALSALAVSTTATVSTTVTALLVNLLSHLRVTVQSTETLCLHCVRLLQKTGAKSVGYLSGQVPSERETKRGSWTTMP